MSEYPVDETDPPAVFPQDIVSAYWDPKEIQLGEERTLVRDPCLGSVDKFRI